MRVTALVPAAGTGSRFGGTVPKQYVRLGDRPVLSHTLGILDSSFDLDEIIVIVAAGEEERCRTDCIDPFGIKKVSRIVAGGEERQDSVNRGLQAVSGDADIVLVHDGARPFVTSSMVKEVIECAVRSGSAVAAIPVRDTLKSVEETGFISETVGRRSLYLAQTPQAFSNEILKEAYSRASRESIRATDDAALVERLGHQVRIVSGSWENIKITHPEDLVVAERILRIRSVDPAT